MKYETANIIVSFVRYVFSEKYYVRLTRLQLFGVLYVVNRSQRSKRCALGCSGSHQSPLISNIGKGAVYVSEIKSAIIQQCSIYEHNKGGYQVFRPADSSQICANLATEKGTRDALKLVRDLT